MDKVCVYCGSSSGSNTAYAESAKQLAQALLKRDIGLVYGGASIGLMGELADAMLAGGGTVVGVIPKALAKKEVAHGGLSELTIVDSMHERKATMAKAADGFIALPGGLGTLEELFEMLTWAQLGIHSKPCAILNSAGYYNQLIDFLDRAVEENFIKPVYRNMLVIDHDAVNLLDKMLAYEPPQIERLIDDSGT